MQFTLVLLTLGFCISAGWPLLPSTKNDSFQESSNARHLHLSGVHDRLLRKWLSTHADLRPAGMEDCVDRRLDSAGKEHRDSCERLVQELRTWTKDAETDPWYAKGDFNGDGAEDFAVVLTATHLKKGAPKSATVVVFNGPFRAGGSVKPAFLQTRRSVSETFLGFGPPRPKPWHLIIGLPESEGAALVWRDGRYVLR